jgi:hypothetical protein
MAGDEVDFVAEVEPVGGAEGFPCSSEARL